jgi:hypothetical protein
MTGDAVRLARRLLGWFAADWPTSGLRWSRGAPLLALAIVGCTRDLGHVQMIAADSMESGFMTLARGVEGRSCGTEMFFGLVPVGTRASLAAAVDDAVGKVPESHLLADVSVEVQTWEALLVRRHCIRLLATAGRRVRVISIP